jgi:threonine aldolase
MKPSFTNDYSEGAHPRILEALQKTNLVQTLGYGKDEYCQKAADLIRKQLGDKNADIHFLSGGTQANLIILSAILRPHESVIAANTGHIAVNEAGAIEATGHKVNSAAHKNGKLTIDNIKEVFSEHTGEHMVKPKAVYISNSTELGSIYTKQELRTLSEFCKTNELYLVLDGARLGSALASKSSDLSLKDIADLVDIFYIGGTKNGALFGEAIVITNDLLKEEFRYHLKQKGALLAKGRVLGIQFAELFADDLFFELGDYANKMAQRIAESVEAAGYEFLSKPESNVLFPILPNSVAQKLEEHFHFSRCKPTDEKHTAIRIVTSWATPEGHVQSFMKEITNSKQS